MNNIAKEIIKVSIEEELKKSYLDYAMSVIIGRALPDVRDGLKPVHRRILYAMKELSNNWNKSYKKSARIVGDVIGKYHPHGDNAVYDTIVRMAQFFSMRYMLIDGQGNFGSIDGDSAAAMRYTEIRMSKIAHEMLIDLDKDTVDYEYNYDNTELIPKVMPTRIPNLLINGSSGIAVGMATNIPPHNLSEIINGCLAYIDDNSISIENLMNYIPGPDFPTFGIIKGSSGIKQAYLTGKGKICIQSRTKIIPDFKTGRNLIIINEIPYQVNKARLIEKISLLVKEKKIEGINNIRDESDKDGIRIVIELKKDVIGKVILNNLFSMTQLQISFGINMVAICNGQPRILSLKEILSEFINHRREIITRRKIFELKKAEEKACILESLIIIFHNSKSIIKLIQTSPTIEIAKCKLMKISWDASIIRSILIQNDKKNSYIKYMNKQLLETNNNDYNYYFTELQAQSILDLRLQKFTHLEKDKIFNEYKNLLVYINNLNNILNNFNLLTNILKKELNEIKNKYEDIRRTEINKNNLNINTEDLINQKEVVVTLSHKGYVKYQPIKDYEAQHRGGKGKSAARIKEKDFIYLLLIANTHDTILLFSSLGRVYWMKIYNLPEASRESRGKPIINIIPLNKNERITAILPIQPSYKNEMYVFMATSNGKVKKTSLEKFSRPRNSGILAIKLHKNDELIGVNLTNGFNDIMLFSSFGKVVRFNEKQVRNMGRTAFGICGMSLEKKDKVVSLIIPKKHIPILTVTQNGYGKRTNQYEYPIKSRSTKGVISIKVNKRNGNVIGAIQVDDYDQVMIITNFGKLVRIHVSEINIISRNTSGVTLMRTDNNEKLVGIQRIVELI